MGFFSMKRKAHDALADVRATMSLARLLRDRAPKTFAWALGLADRDHARELLLAPPGALLLRMVGGAPFVRPLVVVSGVQDDRSAYLCVDVSVDPALYLGLDAGELVALIDTPHSPIVKVRANTHPVMWPLKPGAPEVDRLLPLVRDRAVSQPATDAVGRRLDPQEIDRRVSLVLDAVEFSVAARAAAEAIRAARPPRPYVEQQLYESFPDQAGLPDRRRISSDGPSWTAQSLRTVARHAATGIRRAYSRRRNSGGARPE